jgi:DNA-3-methyladenine glycosylase
VDRTLDGSDLISGPVRIEPRVGQVPRLRRGPRVGVAYAGAWAARPLRFWIEDDPHVSRG